LAAGLSALLPFAAVFVASVALASASWGLTASPAALALDFRHIH
jgi:hypothetical protein